MRSIHGWLDQLQPLIPVSIGAPASPAERYTYTALIDTGATRTCITRTVIAALSLQGKRKLLVSGETSSPERRMNYGYSLGLFCGDAVGANSLYVIPHEFVAPWFLENGNFDVLLGMDVLSQGRLIFEPGGQISFSFDF